MADAPNNWTNFQNLTDEMVAKVAEALQNATNLVQVETGGNLGMLAFAPDLARAPMGNLATMQQRLGIGKVAGLGTVGPNSGNLLLNGAHGLGSSRQPAWPPTSYEDNPKDVPAGLYRSGSDVPFGYGTILWEKYDEEGGSLVFFGIAGSVFSMKARAHGSRNGWGPIVTFHHTGNTTRDSNGVLRTASPIFRLATNSGAAISTDAGFAAAGSGAANEQAEGVTSTHEETGVYRIHGSLGFARDNEWPNGFVIPQDANGNNLVFATTDQADDGTLTVRTFEPVVNENGKNAGGAPIDIPSGRWIDFRLEMPEPPTDDYPDDEPAPELTPEEQEQQRIEQLERWRQAATITPRQARLVLSRHGLLSSVNDAIAGIEDDAERETVEIEWEYAVEIERASTWVNTLYSALGLSQEDVDGLFLEAQQI